MKPDITFIPREEIVKIVEGNLDEFSKAKLIAAMCRVNTFSAVKRAGSGHLGTSFSAMDIFVWLYFFHTNILDKGFGDPKRDIFFSSKGHDVPATYGIFYALGLVTFDQLLSFRRLGGLDGHPDISLEGIEANTGSLGMGISKAKGMAWAKRRAGVDGEIFVVTGDGELQEGQIFESMQTVVHQKLNNITVIVDHNKCQTENAVSDVIDLGNLEEKFSAFGWHVDRCDGHNFSDLQRVLVSFKTITDKPKILIADTIKGKGISFMEHPTVLRSSGGVYKFHAGAPSNSEFNDGIAELSGNVDFLLSRFQLPAIRYARKTPEDKVGSGVSSEFVAVAFTDGLISVAERRKDVVLLDADLLGDAKLQRFAKKFPEQFLENGIAEQDMVSAAGGMALLGMLPFVNSFASFLCARANEQIYNNATEKTKIIYLSLYAGLIPAGPGKSHQSLRDIALMGSMPNMTVVHPSNAREAEAVAIWCADEAEESCSVRLNIGPSPRLIDFDTDWTLRFGEGTIINDGEDVVLFSYGPVMLNEALGAAELLANQSVSVRVVAMPWLNRFNTAWLKKVIGSSNLIFVLEDHGEFGGLADHMLSALVAEGILGTKAFVKRGIQGIPSCGAPKEVLANHKVNAESVALEISGHLK